MIPMLLLGLLVGAGHALEIDHVAAVAALVCGKSSRRQIIRHGMIWGAGHTLVLLLVGGTALFVKSSLPQSFSADLEMLVGVMLIGLGLHVLYRLHRDRVHFHRHGHISGAEHIHLHSHSGETRPHDPTTHDHQHPDTTAWRTLIVGFMHGLAGSAALVMGTAATLSSSLLGVAYIALFGIGSIFGMGLISAGMSAVLLPVNLLTGMHKSLHFLIGIGTIAVGAYVIVSTGA